MAHLSDDALLRVVWHEPVPCATPVAERQADAMLDAAAQPFTARLAHTGADALALKLRHRAEHVRDEPTDGGSGVHTLTERDDGNAVPLEQVDELYQMRELAGEAVQRRDVDDLHLALANECEERVERRPILARPAHAVVRERMRNAAAVDLSLCSHAAFLQRQAVRVSGVFDGHASVSDDHCARLRRTVEVRSVRILLRAGNRS